MARIRNLPSSPTLRPLPRPINPPFPSCIINRKRARGGEGCRRSTCRSPILMVLLCLKMTSLQDSDDIDNCCSPGRISSIRGNSIILLCDRKGMVIHGHQSSPPTTTACVSSSNHSFLDSSSIHGSNSRLTSDHNDTR